MNDVLLKIEPADFARLVNKRLRSVLPIFLLCAAVATTLIVIEYRLMLIAFVVMLPALVGVLDVVMVSRSVKTLGPCEVRLDGDSLGLSRTTRVKLDAITLVRVQPDAVVLVEHTPPLKMRGHLLAVEGAAQEPLLAVLRSHGRTVRAEQNSIAQLTAFIWGVLANLVLGKTAAILVLGFIVYTIKGFTEGPGPGWEAGACFGGALLALTVKVLIQRFALSPSSNSSV